MNSVIIGSPGSGKSAGPFLTTLISNFMKKEPPLNIFALDIKPELVKKSIKKSDCGNVKVVDFSDKESYGWDVYSALSEQSTEDEKMRAFDGITRALIVGNSSNKDAFFVNNARNVTKGLLLYYYNKGRGFIDSINAISSNDIMTQINDALEDKKYCPENGMVYSLLKKYSGKDSEAFQDIELTISEYLDIFKNSSVQFQFKSNHKKASPQDLNNSSVFICLPLSLLDEFSSVLRLITYQVCSFLESRGEEWESPILMLVDEMARIGKLDNIKSLLSVGRSAGVSVNMAFQDMSQLESIYSKEDARTIFNLCENSIILSCKDNETCKMLSDLVGEYREEKISRNRTALFHEGDGKQHVSEEYRKILEPSDIQQLRTCQELVLITEGKYYRIKQHRYYQDKTLNKRYKEIMKEYKKGD